MRLRPPALVMRSLQRPLATRLARPLWSLLALLLLLALTGWRHAAQADNIAYFSFNNGTLSPGGTLAANGGTHQATSNLTTTFVSTDSIGGTTVNAQDGAPAGRALVLNGGTTNNGRYIQINAGGTVGYSGISISLADQRNAAGFSNVTLLYTTDGSTYQNVGVTPASSNPTVGAYSVQTFDLSGVAGVNDNANAAFRLVFDGATSTGGFNTIDNLVVSGTSTTPEPETWAMMGIGLMALGLFQRRRRKGTLPTAPALAGCAI